MIRFKCHCGNAFELHDDHAGTMIQCPKCSRLNDVPTLSELQGLDDQGGFKLDALPLVPNENYVARATRAFTSTKYDESGDHIDMRPTVADILAAGTSGESEGEDPGKHVPRYDPFTGE